MGTNSEDFNRILQDAERAQVVRGEDIGDVTVHENLAREQVEHACFRDAGVAAAYPEDLGGLRVCERGEERGAGGGDALRPGAVALQEGVDAVVGGGEAEG